MTQSSLRESTNEAASGTFRSVPDLFVHRIQTTPEREAFREPVGAGWRSYRWDEVGERVRAIASGLRALGLEDEERCAILAGTRVEWIFIDLGILCAGGATTTVYPASTSEECAFILGDSASAFIFCEDTEQVAKVVEKREALPGLRHVIAIEGSGSADGWVITLDDLVAKGNEHLANHPGSFEEVVANVASTDLATLIYTSGTTGRPKGVELTHDNWLYEGEGIEALGLLAPDDVQFLWLPLAHSFGKVLEVAQLKIGFATAVDGRIDKIVDNLASVRPTFVAAVPRIFEKVHNKVVGGTKAAGGLKATIFNWAMGVGRAWSTKIQAGEEPGFWLGMKYSIADKLVFSKLKARFGGRLKYFVSGSAPLSREIANFFHAAGILILEGYGLTESSAATFVNRPHKYKFGTVGLPLPGTEVKIADDGEILIRGRGIMRGYHGLAEVTAETLEDGWLHTGDIGEIDGEGFLKITDRKKDLIKTSGGKYVAPQFIEGKMKAACPYLSQVLVHGNNRNFCTALVAFDEEALREWAATQGLSGSYSEIATSPQAHALIEPYFDQVNADLPRYSTIKKFAVLPADLTVESGELTTSLKLKRKAVEQKYSDMLDTFYSGS